MQKFFIVSLMQKFQSQVIQYVKLYSLGYLDLYIIYS